MNKIVRLLRCFFRFPLATGQTGPRTLLLLLLAGISPVLEASHLKIGLLKHHVEGASFVDEWMWALRGGGADMEVLAYQDILTLNPQLSLLHTTQKG